MTPPRKGEYFGRFDIQALCKSPHDYPAKWVLVLTMYLDESIESDDGYAVVAGFIGTDTAWAECMQLWRNARPPNGFHAKALRVKERHRTMLATLGAIPAKAGLILVFGSVLVRDYSDLIQGNVGEVLQSGYITAMTALISMLMTRLDPMERVEIICETQIEYAGMRELVMQQAQRNPLWQTPSGEPRIAKWSSIARSMILEPSDYATHSLFQRLREPNGWKSIIFSPILNNPSRCGWCMTSEYPRGLVNNAISAHGPLAKANKQQKGALRRQLTELSEENPSDRT